MDANQSPSSPTADATFVDLKPLQPGVDRLVGDHAGLIDLYVSLLGRSSDEAERRGLAHSIVAVLPVTGSAKVERVATLFTHPSREIRHLALETVGEDIDADHTVKFDAVTTMLNQAMLPEYQADALFGILHIADLPTELRFAAAAPYVVSPSAEVRETAIAVLLKHPEIVNGAIYDRLCDIFESAANNEDPKIKANALRALHNVQGFYAANTALDAH